MAILRIMEPGLIAVRVYMYLKKHQRNDCIFSFENDR